MELPYLELPIASASWLVRDNHVMWSMVTSLGPTALGFSYLFLTYAKKTGTLAFSKRKTSAKNN